MSNETTIKAYIAATKEKINKLVPIEYQIYERVAARLSQPLRGKMQRKAVMLLCYGASIRTTVKFSGLSIRRVKVLYKQLRRY